MEKELNAFYRGSCKYGRLNVCKCCDNKRREITRQLNLKHDLEQKQLYYQEHKEYLKRQWEAYYYTHKEEEAKRKRKYYKKVRLQHLKRCKIYYNGHKEERKKYLKKYSAKNPEKIALKNLKYYQTERGFFLCKLKNHRRRMRLKVLKTEDDLTLAQWQKILMTQKGKCNLCHKKFSKRSIPTIDHIIPIFHGGLLTSDNIQALCKSCNSSKHAHMDPQFIQTWNHCDRSKRFTNMDGK